jgi:hypothetical protein
VRLSYEDRRVLKSVRYLNARHGTCSFDDAWHNCQGHRTSRPRDEFALQVARLIRCGYVAAASDRTLALTSQGQTELRLETFDADNDGYAKTLEFR